MFTIKTRIFLLGLFSLLGVILPAQDATANGDQKTLSHDEMATLAMRGTYMFSSGNVDNAEMIFATNFVRHEQQYLTPESNMEDISKLIESQREIYKVEEMQTEPLDTIVDVEGNRVALRWSVNVTRAPTADNEFPEHMHFEGGHDLEV